MGYEKAIEITWKNTLKQTIKAINFIYQKREKL
jgi:hypothetical protein